MKIAAAHEMREVDRITIGEYGVPGLVLMERAGLAVASRFRELYPGKRALILCGGGNNGGDGLVAARDIYNRGTGVNVLVLAKRRELSPECAAQLHITRSFGVPVEFRKVVKKSDLHGSAVVDAVFGTGLNRPVKRDLAEIFSFINSSDVPVISVDMPSGISADTGEILGEAVKAACTVTFGIPKRGHLLYPGAEYAGRLLVEDIGFPSCLLSSAAIKADSVEREFVAGLLPKRRGSSHKGDYGHVLVVAGSRGKTGAAFMTAKACLRSGSGLVTMGMPESLSDVFQGRAVEEMILPLPDDGSGRLSAKAADKILEFASQKADVIAIGPGIGVSDGTVRVMTELVRKSPVPVIVDADGINSLAGTGILRSARSPIILTPHPGEMARLLKSSAEARKSESPEGTDRINTALAFSKATGTYLVLKGAPTVVGSPDGRVFINTTGNPGMAAAGSGDVLTGVIASLLGQGLDPAAAAVLGVYLHGFAGDLAAGEKGEHSLIASDIISFLPTAIMTLV